MDLFEYAESQEAALEIASSIAANRSRVSDPETSRQAAREIDPKLTIRCQQFLSGLLQLGQATANEVGVHVAGSNVGLIGSIRRRASDLYADGLIRIVDRRECRVTGKRVHVYEVV